MNKQTYFHMIGRGKYIKKGSKKNYTKLLLVIAHYIIIPDPKLFTLSILTIYKCNPIL